MALNKKFTNFALNRDGTSSGRNKKNLKTSPVTQPAKKRKISPLRGKKRINLGQGIDVDFSYAKGMNKKTYAKEDLV